jgi:hypothetical protein
VQSLDDSVDRVLNACELGFDSFDELALAGIKRYREVLRPARCHISPIDLELASQLGCNVQGYTLAQIVHREDELAQACPNSDERFSGRERVLIDAVGLSLDFPRLNLRDRSRRHKGSDHEAEAQRNGDDELPISAMTAMTAM